MHTMGPRGGSVCFPSLGWNRSISTFVLILHHLLLCNFSSCSHLIQHLQILSLWAATLSLKLPFTSPFFADILGSCLSNVLTVYPLFSNQGKLGNILMSFPHKSRERAQVRIMWLEFLFSLLSDICPLTRQTCQFAYCQHQQYTSCAFWSLFSNILPDAIKAELYFSKMESSGQNATGWECQAQSS